MDPKRLKPTPRDEARWLREMFQAVWPDLGVFKGGIKVASLTGSLSFSLLFFGVVYYMSTQYDAARGASDTAKHGTQAQEPGLTNSNSQHDHKPA